MTESTLTAPSYSNLSPSSSTRPTLSWGGLAIATWGVVGILLLLGQALWRLTPLAIEPVARGMMSPLHWSLYLSWAALNAYMEGYRGFQLSFSPMVAERAISLGQRPTPLFAILAPFYCMALFAAPRRRMLVSWFIIFAVLGLILLIRQLSQPWRGIVDVGVVVGLTWGALSILYCYIQALRGRPLPQRKRRR